MSVDEMRDLLLREYGIASDEDLEKELHKNGGVKIAIFVDPKDSSDD